MYVYMLFGSTGRTMRAENILHRAGVSGKLVPAPWYISSDCGVCLRVEAGSVEAARRALSAARLEPVSVHDEWRLGTPPGPPRPPYMAPMAQPPLWHISQSGGSQGLAR